MIIEGKVIKVVALKTKAGSSMPRVGALNLQRVAAPYDVFQVVRGISTKERIELWKQSLLGKVVEVECEGLDDNLKPIKPKFIRFVD